VTGGTSSFVCARSNLRDKTQLRVKTQASEESSPVPLPEIMNQLRKAATSVPRGPGPGFHSLPIFNALNRASRKSFVRALKPFRRLLRNQGAVNDSLLEALYHLSAQTQEMIEEMSELQRRVSTLQTQIRLLRAENGDAQTTPVVK
jgi:hypothetical protein